MTGSWLVDRSSLTMATVSGDLHSSAARFVAYDPVFAHVVASFTATQ